MNTTNNVRRANIRWQLLATVSAFALTASVYTASEALAADSDSGRPLIWIEVGGQLSKLDDAAEPFAPSFMVDVTRPSLLSALDVQRQPSYAFDSDGAISFQPDDSNWIFSAAVRFGRSQAIEHRNHQTNNSPIKEFISIPTFGISPQTVYKYPDRYVRFAEGQSQQSERHLILDFQVGKDVGLGMFGGNGTSVLHAGVRFASFKSKADVRLAALPDVQYPTYLGGPGLYAALGALSYVPNPKTIHDFVGQITSERSFSGLGPSLAWNASVPFAGSPESGELTLDWGASAALLFGRQRASGQYSTAVRTYEAHGMRNNFTGGHGKGTHSSPYNVYFFGGDLYYHPFPHTRPGTFKRERSVTVPNLGGFAGMSFRYADAKISLGYKADFFFNAIDGGIDKRKTENRGFFGPYASISIGIGD